MTIIYAATEDQHLVATILPKLAQNNVNTVRLSVDFDASWDTYTARSAVFTTSKSVRPYSVKMSASGDCLIPPEVLAEECKLYIVVEGVNSSTGAKKSSTRLTVKVLGGHPAVIISDPSPSVYQQLLTANAVLASRMSELEAGGTVDGSEVIGIRTGADGKVYPTAGDATRGQAQALHNLVAPLTGTSLESNPFQPILFQRSLYYRGHNSPVADEATDPVTATARLGDCVRYLTIEKGTDTSYAVGGELLAPIPVVDNSTGEYLLLIKSDVAMDGVIINFSSGTAWGSDVHTLLNFRINVAVGYNVIPLDSIGHTNNSHATYNYIWVRHAGFASVSDFSIQIVKGRDVYGWLMQELGEVKSAVPDYDGIVCWGDSLTAGGGWTTKLQELSGMTVYNAGTGGENVRTITARQGADVIMVNDVTIPATSTPVTLATYASPFKTALGYTATPLLQGGAHVNPVKLGGIEGTLRWTGSSYSDTSGTWTFTRSEAGEQVVINRPTALTTAYDREKNSPHLMVIFMGQNGGYSDNEELVNLHRLMIAHANAKHVIVLGLSSGSATSRAEYEAAMKKAFGRYFISLREYLSQYGLADAGLTPTTADTTAMMGGTVPPQLLADNVHYTDATKTVIGNLIYKRCCELGIFEA